MKKLWLLLLLAIAFPAFADTEGEPGQPFKSTQPNAVRFPLDRINGNSIAIGNNALIGQALGPSFQAGYQNIAIGYNALSSLLGNVSLKNLAIGYNACPKLTGVGATNVCLGYNAGAKATTAFSSMYIGANAGNNVTTQDYNIILDSAQVSSGVPINSIMVGAFSSAGSPTNSVIMGYQAGLHDTTGGSYQEIIGANVGLNNIGNGHTATNVILLGGNGTSSPILDGATTSTNTVIGIGNGQPGTGDTMVGYGALGANTVDNGNQVAFGFNALNGSTTGTFNSAFGYSAGSSITTGTNNLTLGYQVGSSTLTTGNSNILIGTSSAVTAATSSTSNEINIGGLLFYNNNSTSAPAVSACGTGSPAIDANANNKSGTVTAGTVATTCTITFAGTGYSTWDHCRVTAQGEGTVNASYSYTTTAITVTAGALGGAKIDYDCDGV